MEYRPLRLAARLILLTALVLASAHAEDKSGATPEQKADWETRLNYAKALQKDGKEKKSAAVSKYEATKVACFKRFRVTDCQEDARTVYIKATAEARRIENRGLALERQIKKERLADKDARHIEEAPEREADLKQREADTAAERAQAEEQRAKTLADKKRKAEENTAKRAKEAEKRLKKQEKHEKMVAEKMEKARRREAEAAE